ncbi:MAG: pantoate--beta-alanine ligase [Gemmatimonadota bacterium]
MRGNPARAAGTTLLHTVREMRQWREDQRGSGRTVGLVPTMGFLHEGHLSLVDRCRELAGATVLSLFVNPTQFGPGEDFAEYPRDLERDLALSEERGVDVLFAPEDREMYPVPQSIWVEPGELARRLCGLSRPTHFRGVLTVVAKLFGIVEPGVAVFGRKDYQQAVLIRRMVEELRLPVRIEMAPIVREPDGLAMSSRNAYLSPSEREAALSLSRGLRRARAAYAEGDRSPGALRERVRETLEAGGARVEYVEIVDPESLEPIRSEPGPDAVCAVAAHAGNTRLIDNAPLGEGSSLDEVGGVGGPAAS